ncbi:MAG TPA: GatB/YqeY domain-containing protein [Gammaproteobacteria bacterium]|nr:GatB/YqeY domain-containing protein [Gammaproteobacteria bacterium]
MSESLKARIQSAMKDAMRAKEKERLGVIRLIMAAIKQREVDERIELDDEQIVLVIDKMIKQRRESISQFDAAGRDDLSAVEKAELEILQTFMPEQLSEDEVNAMIDKAMAETGASSMKDMGKVMGLIKPQAQGKADMGVISKLIKEKLSS